MANSIKTNWGRWMIIFTLLVGVIFHTTRLIIGVEAFQEIFTATIDAIFSIPMILGIVGSIMTWPYFNFRNRIEKGVVIITIAYFALTMPLHFRTWFTQNTDYIASFPWWYSLIFLSYTTILLIVWMRLRIQSNSYQKQEYLRA